MTRSLDKICTHVERAFYFERFFRQRNEKFRENMWSCVEHRNLSKSGRVTKALRQVDFFSWAVTSCKVCGLPIFGYRRAVFRNQIIGFSKTPRGKPLKIGSENLPILFDFTCADKPNFQKKKWKKGDPITLSNP